MKLLAILLCCVYSSLAQQHQPVADNGIYLSGSDFMQHTLHLPFNKKEGSFKSPLGHYHELWLKTKDSIYKFYDDDIWGYRQHKKDYRVFKSDPYKIIYTGKIIIYEIPSTPGNGTGRTAFFSKDLQSPVYGLTKKQLIDVYHGDAAFIEKIKSMKWNESIFKWNKTTGHYEFIDWLN
jgi:hypothetical protein